MTPGFVVDCSVTMTWFFKDELTDNTPELLDRLSAEPAVVPAVWFLEVLNVLALAERKGRATADESNAFLADLGKLDFHVDHHADGTVFSRLLPLCRTYQLTSYDGIYLDIAMRYQLPLATLDKPLRAAAGQLGVPVLGL